MQMITANTYLPPLFENGVLKYEIINDNRIKVYSMIKVSNRAKGNISSYVKQFLNEPIWGEYSFSFNYWVEKNELGHDEYVLETWYRR